MRGYIKTFEEACRKLRSNHVYVKEYEAIMHCCEGLTKDICAYLKLRIITAALNRECAFHRAESKYYPVFSVRTKEFADSIKEERIRQHFCCYGKRYVHVTSGISLDVMAVSPVNLSYKSCELAEYSGQQFIAIWMDYISNKPTLTRNSK